MFADMVFIYSGSGSKQMGRDLSNTVLVSLPVEIFVLKQFCTKNMCNNLFKPTPNSPQRYSCYWQDLWWSFFWNVNFNRWWIFVWFEMIQPEFFGTTNFSPITGNNCYNIRFAYFVTFFMWTKNLVAVTQKLIYQFLTYNYFLWLVARY